MIDSIRRDGTAVVLRINVGLDVKMNLLIFKWETEDEIFAELLKDHLREQLTKNNNQFKHEIALKPYYYLEPEEISELKSKLVKEWNGSKHCWK